jgi:tetratricopeptide (TPR) repeat protein
LYYELEDYGNAEKYLLKSLSMHPNFEAALYYIGKTYIKLGRNKDATISFKKILEIDPDCKKAKEELSKIN